jgi:hypothetical protein
MIEILDGRPMVNDNGVMRPMTNYEFAKYRAEVGVPVYANVGQAKYAKLADIRRHFSNLVDMLRNSLATYEVESWPIQTLEYSRYLADPEAPTPYVDGLAYGRGLSRVEVMDKIGIKVRSFAALQGSQHGMEDRVDAATTVAEVEAIVVG